MKKHLTCEWEYDEEESAFHTECEDAFCLTEGTLKENHMKYCPMCGKLIKELKTL